MVPSLKPEYDECGVSGNRKHYYENKISSGDKYRLKLPNLKDDVLKYCTQYIVNLEKLIVNTMTGKGQFSFQIQRGTKMPKEYIQNYCTSFSNFTFSEL